MGDDGKRHVIKLETKMTLGLESPEFQLERRRAAIKAALVSATANLAAATSALAAQIVNFEEPGDGGLPPGGAPPQPPWGEVIMGPIWAERIQSSAKSFSIRWKLVSSFGRDERIG